jgi:hypothetical protein
MATLLLAGTLAAAQSGLTPPQIGFLRDSAGNVRPLLGISGNFWLGDAVAAHVVSAASSGKASMLKTGDSLRVLNALGHPLGRAWVAPGSALFAFAPSGTPALVWLPDSGHLLRWNGLRFEPTRANPVELNGAVVSVAAPDSSRAAFLVQRDGQLWRIDLSLFDGAILFAAALPGATAPALLLDDGSLLYTGKSSLILRDPQGTERAIAFHGTAVRFTPMGRDWILIETSLPSTQFGLRLSTGAVFELPEPAQ